ncbi:unnamed protein product [Rhizophagus irregularis]|nr:unnamed protein product [Rhizophagus irregularis]
MVQFQMTQDQQFNNNDRRPPRKLVNNSDIVGLQHFAIFSSWIERKDDFYYDTETYIPYEFKLLYRANRDGYTSDAFHSRCDNKGATIVILKIPNSEQILGGYNPLQWDSSNTRKHTRDSFLFSFTNRIDLNSATIGRNRRRNDANYDSTIQCYRIYGPAFGSSGGFDLFQDSDGEWKSHNPHTYCNIDIPEGYGEYYNFFDVENYEVFQVVKI